MRRSVTRRETEALSPGLESGGGQKRGGKVSLRVYSVPSHLILYQPSRGWSRQSAWIGYNGTDATTRAKKWLAQAGRGGRGCSRRLKGNLKFLEMVWEIGGGERLLLVVGIYG